METGQRYDLIAIISHPKFGIGQTAVKVDDPTVVITKQVDGSFTLQDGSPLALSPENVNSKWIPQIHYVDFMTAFDAWMEGKAIEIHRKGINTPLMYKREVYPKDPDDMSWGQNFKSIDHIVFKAIDIAESKWVIQKER